MEDDILLPADDGGDEEVDRLSKSRQRKSLGETKRLQDERAKINASKSKSFQRTTVVNPRLIQWPELLESENKEILGLLQNLIPILNLSNRKVPLSLIRGVPKDERAQFRRSHCEEQLKKSGRDIRDYQKIRTSLALGVNCVSKSLERSQLLAVLVDKDVDPPMITKLLIPIAVSKQVPILALTGLNSAFKQFAGMSCVALGLKTDCGTSSHHFHPVLELARKLDEARSNRNQNQEAQKSSTPQSASSNTNRKQGKKSKSGTRLPFTPAKIRKITQAYS